MKYVTSDPQLSGVYVPLHRASHEAVKERNILGVPARRAR